MLSYRKSSANTVLPVKRASLLHKYQVEMGFKLSGVEKMSENVECSEAKNGDILCEGLAGGRRF